MPDDIEEDQYASECIFEVYGSDAPPESNRPSCPVYCPGIKTSDELLKKCESIRGTCSRISINGHGIWGCGVRARIWGKVKKTKCDVGDNVFGCGIMAGLVPGTDEIAACFGRKLRKSGYVRICSCFSHPEEIDKAEPCLQTLANLIKVKVCMCAGDHANTSKHFCHCYGTWICRDPE